MNSTLKKNLESRYDLSDYVFHFTSGENAKDSLESILSDRKIKDIKSKGRLCFTEAPLTSLVEMFKIFEKYKKPMYAPYGIAILKEELFSLGGRPAIYGPKGEKEMIDKSIAWRYVEYEPDTYDFTWLREWRIQKEELDLNNSNHFVVIKTKAEEYEYAHNDDTEIEVDGCISGDGQFWPEYYLAFKREWKTISIERIAELAILSQKSYINEVSNQEIGGNAFRMGLGGG